jgi:hypothetical protein
MYLGMPVDTEIPKENKGLKDYISFSLQYCV